MEQESNQCRVEQESDGVATGENPGCISVVRTQGDQLTCNKGREGCGYGNDSAKTLAVGHKECAPDVCDHHA